jgi:hypothetical protein
MKRYLWTVTAAMIGAAGLFAARDPRGAPADGAAIPEPGGVLPRPEQRSPDK